jgi:hypothetical protein
MSFGIGSIYIYCRFSLLSFSSFSFLLFYGKDRSLRRAGQIWFLYSFCKISPYETHKIKPPPRFPSHIHMTGTIAAEGISRAEKHNRNLSCTKHHIPDPQGLWLSCPYHRDGDRGQRI